MTTITLHCKGASAWAHVEGRITRGMVGLTVEIHCDESWDGLTRTLVCKNGLDGGCGSYTMLAVGDTTVVPHEALLEEGNLYLCLEGRNDDGHLVLPTSWADCGRIYDSGTGILGTEAPTPNETEQLLTLAGQAKRIAAEADRIAREAIDKANAAPDLDGYATVQWVEGQGYLKEDELQDAVDGALLQAKNSGAFDGPRGPQGERGPQGPAGSTVSDDHINSLIGAALNTYAEASTEWVLDLLSGYVTKATYDETIGAAQEYLGQLAEYAKVVSA